MNRLGSTIITVITVERIALFDKYNHPFNEEMFYSNSILGMEPLPGQTLLCTETQMGTLESREQLNPKFD